jgi:hypothetical protein
VILLDFTAELDPAAPAPRPTADAKGYAPPKDRLPMIARRRCVGQQLFDAGQKIGDLELTLCITL